MSLELRSSDLQSGAKGSSVGWRQERHGIEPSMEADGTTELRLSFQRRVQAKAGELGVETAAKFM